MVSIVTTGIVRGWRRFDAVGLSAVVLAVNAIVFLGIAAIGALFLTFFFADESESWSRLWPLVAGWAAAAALGTANAVVAARFARRPADTPRVSDGTVALITAVSAGALLVLPSSASTALLFLAAPFALANVGAAWFLYGAAYAPPQPIEFPSFVPAADQAPEFDPTAAFDPAAFDLAGPLMPAAGATMRPFIPSALLSPNSGAFRGLRGRAATTTLSGIRLPRRARRTPKR
jgi:hypothetical protein